MPLGGVAEGVAVTVAVGEAGGVCEAVGEPVPLTLTLTVPVGEPEAGGVPAALRVGVPLADAASDAVLEGVAEGVRVLVVVGVRVGVPMGVSEGEGGAAAGVAVALLVGVLVCVAAAAGVMEGVAGGVCVRVRVIVGGGVLVGVRERERVWLGVRDAATPKSAKESMVTVPVPVAEPKHAFIHTEGRLSRIPVVAGMPPVDQVWKLPAIPIVALAATLVHVLPLLVLYQNWYGIVLELTLMYPTTLPSLPTCTWVNPEVDVFIITPPHVEVAA